ncbi:cysteine--1-D-myo-inosityl 2-amino-2-deoxy-alpha-D-glucopyranoside ligase, partial [Actinoallomurus acaciae]
AVRLAGGPSAATSAADLRRHLADDLDAPSALAAVDRWVDHALSVVAEDREDEGTAPDVFRRAVDALLGIVL